MSAIVGALRIVGTTLLVAAVVQELKKPSKERTWRGRLAFSVPYDLTLPTPVRLREAYWNPADDRIVTDKVLGVGWAINVHALLRKLRLMDITGCAVGREARER